MLRIDEVQPSASPCSYNPVSRVFLLSPTKQVVVKPGDFLLSVNGLRLGGPKFVFEEAIGQCSKAPAPRCASLTSKKMCPSLDATLRIADRGHSHGVITRSRT